MFWKLAGNDIISESYDIKKEFPWELNSKTWGIEHVDHIKPSKRSTKGPNPSTPVHQTPKNKTSFAVGTKAHESGTESTDANTDEFESRMHSSLDVDWMSSYTSEGKDSEPDEKGLMQN